MLQSSYRKNHSTETALLKVRNDILLNMNRQQVTLLVLLDFSSAFDTVSHEILLHRLHEKLGVKDTALKWFKSYLSGRTQRIIIDGKVSRKFPLSSGVPQGSCLGPLLFNIYVSSLIDVIDRHLPNAHSYADDFQLYLSFSPSDASKQLAALESMQDCIAVIRSWARKNSLMLNDKKTEFMIIGMRPQLLKINVDSIRVGDDAIPKSTPVRNLGSWFDETFSMATHITKTCSASFHHLHNIRRIRKYLSIEAAETLVHAFVTSRVDYCNSLLYGLPLCQLAKVQRVQNAAARIIVRESKYCHITPVLQQLHWLPVFYRIKFKILLTTFKAIHGTAPGYLCELVQIRKHSKYHLRSDDGLLLKHPSMKSLVTLGDRSFMFAAPSLWNRLPTDIRNCSSIEKFKAKLKTHFFSEAFDL